MTAEAAPNQLERLARGLLYALAFTIPLEKTVQFGAFGTIAAAIGAAAAGVAGVAIVRRGGLRRRLHDLHLLQIAFLGWSLASLMWTISTSLTVERVGTTAQLVVMVVLIWEFCEGTGPLRRLSGAFVLSALVVALLTVGDAVTSDGARFTAPGTNPNDSAFLLTLAVPLAWQLGLTTGHTTRRLLWWAAVPLMLGAVVLTASRSALLIGVVALAVVPATTSRLSVRSRTWLSMAVVAVAAVAALVAPEVLPARSLERLGTIGDEIATGDLNNRSDLWGIAFDISAEEPILGVGAGASRQVVGAVRGIENGVHNTLLSVLADLGVVGLALWMLMGVVLGRSLLRVGLPGGRFGLILLATLVVGVMPRHWEHRKATWLVLALLLELAVSGWDIVRPVAVAPGEAEPEVAGAR